MMQEPCWTIHDIVTATGGRLVSGPADVRFSGVSIDSRQIAADDFFVAIQGAAHDGHQYILEIIKKGITGIVAEDRWVSGGLKVKLPAHVACISVENTIQALGDLAAFHRRRFDIPVICITGSNGKTTTKEMTALVLGQKFHVLKTSGNFNNEIGVPLTLFRLNRTHGAAVVELGMNHPGEIRRLSSLCAPDAGIITNVGPAHLEGLGAVENVMAAKGELIENIKKTGAIILNHDNGYCRQLGEISSRRVMFYGKSKSGDADVFAANIKACAGAVTFDLKLPDASAPVTLHAPGEFMVGNALAAAAAGHVFGIRADQISAALDAFRPVNGRMDIKPSRHGFYIIDDTYNANPGSMEAVITTLASVKGRHRGVLVAGDMLELGDRTEILHEHIGAFAARAGINQLFLCGRYAASVKKGALAAGMAADNIVIRKKQELPDLLLASLSAGDWMAVKGSRSTGMEEILRHLALEGASDA